MVVMDGVLTGLFNKFLYRDSKDVPDPPPLPPYDPQKEAPMWSESRIIFSLPIDNSTWSEIGTTPKDPSKPDWRGVVKNNVVPLPVPDAYKLGRYNSSRYFWFDTPDYADPFKKLWYATKWFGITGAFATSAYGAFHCTPFNFKSVMSLSGKIFAPWFFGGMAGCLGLLTLANIRGKDDRWNYAAGAVVASTILGRGPYMRFVLSVVISVPIAVYIKYAAETNGYIVPELEINFEKSPVGGYDHKHGWRSGDWRIIIPRWGEPGRDQR